MKHIRATCACQCVAHSPAFSSLRLTRAPPPGPHSPGMSHGHSSFLRLFLPTVRASPIERAGILRFDSHCEGHQGYAETWCEELIEEASASSCERTACWGGRSPVRLSCRLSSQLWRPGAARCRQVPVSVCPCLYCSAGARIVAPRIHLVLRAPSDTQHPAFAVR